MLHGRLCFRAGREMRDFLRAHELRRRLREDVPTAHSQLAAGDQISVLISPEATAALALLRRGTERERDVHKNS